MALLLAGGAADAQQARDLALGQGGPVLMGPSGNPSDIVSAEIAFAQLSRDEGQWTGFRKTADKDAVLFVPGVVNAQAWLRKRADPPKSVAWSPTRIFIACDGSYGVAHGHATHADGRKAGYVTIWRRQPKGDYKWILDWSTDAPPGEPEIIDGKVADCARHGLDNGIPSGRSDRELVRDWRKRQKYDVVRIADPPPASGAGRSRDGTLGWQWTTAPDGARSLKVTVRYGGETRSFIDDERPAGG